ncbi:outer membrane protein assembly factor BamB family protein [Natronobiforma cellulositropha]|uniref:outer membrane protein assembly factor BamB family protein n=1 Tax=Natronobiforma cellulositropha TaxID=1679076 RepID=UPI0021D56F5D|nr:PQQ-binding-like beta-propeller repeat protein [Natronobiforma cellulositropha]
MGNRESRTPLQRLTKGSRIVLATALCLLVIVALSPSGAVGVDGYDDPVALAGAGSENTSAVAATPDGSSGASVVDETSLGSTAVGTGDSGGVGTLGFTTQSDEPEPVDLRFIQVDEPTNSTPYLMTEWQPIVGGDVAVRPQGGDLIGWGMTNTDGVWTTPPLESGAYTREFISTDPPVSSESDFFAPRAEWRWAHFPNCGQYLSESQTSQQHYTQVVTNGWPTWADDVVGIEPEVAVAGKPVTISACNPFEWLDYELEWEFDDGTTATGEQFTVVFDEPGTYEFWPVDGPAHRTEITVVDLEITRAMGGEWLAVANDTEDFYQVTSDEDERDLVSVTIGDVETEEVGSNDFRAALESRHGQSVEVVAEFDDGTVVEVPTGSATLVDPDWVRTLVWIYGPEATDEWCDLDGDWPDGEVCGLWDVRHEAGIAWAGIPGTPWEDDFAASIGTGLEADMYAPTGDLQGAVDAGGNIAAFGVGVGADGKASAEFDGVEFQGALVELRGEQSRTVRSKTPASQRGVGDIQAKLRVHYAVGGEVWITEEFVLEDPVIDGEVGMSGVVEGSVFGASAHGEVYGNGSTYVYLGTEYPIERVDLEANAGVRGGVTLYGLYERNFDYVLLEYDGTIYEARPVGTTVSTDPFTSFDSTSLSPASTLETAADAEEASRLRPASGPQPLAGVPSVDESSIGAFGTLSSPEPSILDERTERLTNRPYEDSEPTMAATTDGYAVLWSSLADGSPVEDGQDLRVRHYDEELGWGETVAVTDDDRHDFEPTLASLEGSDDLLAAWTRLDAPVSDLDGPEEAAAHLEIATAHFDGETWSEATLRSSGEALDRAPVVAASEDGWLVAWMHHANDDRLDVANAAVEYRLFDADAELVQSGTVQHAALPAVGTRADGTFDLAFVETETNTLEDVTVVHGQVDADGFDGAGALAYAVAGYGDHAVDGGDLVWTRDHEGETVLEHAAGGAVETLSVDGEQTPVSDLVVRSSGEQTLVLYRGTPGVQNTSDLVYRYAVDGEWSGDHRLVGGPEEDLTIWHADAILGDEGFTAAYAIQEPGIENRNDVFVTTEPFGPRYDVGADGPANANAGETVVVDATIRNVGTSAGAAVSVVATDGIDTATGEPLATETVDALAVNESVTVPLEVVVPDGGTVTVGVDALETPAVDEWFDEETTVRLGAPSLVVAVAEGEMHSATNGTLTLGVENQGGTNASDVLVRVDDGDAWTTNATLEVPAGAVETVTVPVDLSTFNTSALDRVTIDPEGALGDAARPAFGEVSTRLFTPDLRVHGPPTYATVEHYEEPDRANVTVAASNWEPFATNATVSVYDHEDDTFLGEKRVELGPRGEHVLTAERVAVPVSELAVGQTLRVELAHGDDAIGRLDVVVDEVEEIEREALAAVDVRVFDEVTGEALENARVRSGLDAARTGSDGLARVELDEAESVSISKDGYETAFQNVAVTGGDLLEAAVRLSPRLTVDAVEAPDRADPGESVTVTATVRNDAEVELTSVVTLTADGSDVASEPVTVGPEGTTTVDFVTSAPSAETVAVYGASVAGPGARTVTAVGVESSGAGPVSVDDVVAPAAVDVGSSASVSVTATNDGDDPVVRVATVRLSGPELDAQPIGAVALELAPGQSVTAPVGVVIPDVPGGEYELTVDVGEETVSDDVTVRDPGDEIWAFETGGDVTSSPTVAGEIAYVGSHDGAIYAVDRDTGTEVWRFETGGPVHSAPAVADGTVYVGSHDGTLYALDAHTGELQWEYETNVMVTSSPTVADGTVYLGGGALYAIDAETGTAEWLYGTGAWIEAAPTVADGTVYVGTYAGNDHNGSLHAVDAQTGAGEWSLETDDNVTSSATVADGTVYVGSHAGTLYALESDTGAPVWTYQAGALIYSSPTVADGAVFVGTDFNGEHRGLRAFDAATGTPSWVTNAHTNASMRSSPTVADGTVYVGDSIGTLYAFDVETGAQEWTAETDVGISSSPTVADGALYVGSEDASLYALSTGGDRTSDGSRVALGTLGHVADDSSGSLVVDALDVPENVAPGAPVTVTATVRNDAPEAGLGTVTLFADGVEVASETVAVGPDGETTVDLTTTAPDVRSAVLYEARATGDGVRAVTAVDVDETVGGPVSLDDVSAPASVAGDETVQVSITATNDGDDPAHRVVTVRLDGADLDDRLVGAGVLELGAGESATEAIDIELPALEESAYDLLVTVDGQTVSRSVTVAEPGELQWAFETDERVTSSPTVADSIAYVGSRDHHVYAVDVETGEEVWRFETEGEVHASPAVDGGTVYVGSFDNHLYALDADTGELYWRTDTYSQLVSSPTVADGTVYIGGGSLSAIDAQTGALEWTYLSPGFIESSPTVVDDVVYVTSYDTSVERGHINAVGTEPGVWWGQPEVDLMWVTEIDDQITASPTVADGTVYVGTRGGELYALEPDTGDQQWVSDAGGGIHSSPTVADGVVYVGTGLEQGDRLGLYAADADTGEEVWFSGAYIYSSVLSSPTVADGTVYVGDHAGLVHAIDGDTGDQEWSYTTGGSIRSSPTVADGTLYVGSNDASLYAISVEEGRTSEDSRVTLRTLGHVVGIAPSFTLDSLETDAPVTAGETLIVTATVENTGADGEQTVTLEVGGEVRDSQTLDLEAGETGTVTLEWETTDDDAGDHEITVSSDDDSVSESIRVQAVGEVVFVIDAFETDSLIEAGETVTVTASVRNAGTAHGEQTITFNVNGEVHDSTTLSIGAGWTMRSTLEWETTDTDVGIHEITLSTDDDSVSETVAVDAGNESEFVLSEIETNSPITERDTLTVDVTIENVGDAAGVETVVLRALGEDRSEATVELEPGENETVTLEWHTTDGDSPTTSDTFAVGIIGTDDSAVEHVLIRVYEAIFAIESVETNGPVDAGETLTVTATVENTGSASGEQSVTLEIDGEVHDAQTLDLDAGATETVTLEWQTDDDVGDHEITVSTDDTVVFIAPSFSVHTLEPNDPVTAGETLTVTATVHNLGNAAGTESLLLEADGEVRDDTTVTLEPGEATAVTLEWETGDADAGRYQIMILGGIHNAFAVVTLEEGSGGPGLPEPTTPEFSLTGVETNTPIETGDTLTVTIEVENVGDGDGSQTLELAAGGETRDTAVVALDAGATETVTLEWETDDADAGDHEITVSSDNDSASEPITVEAVGEATFVLEALETNAPLDAGETVTVTAPVENTGTAGGEQTVTLEVGGEVRDAQTLGLGAGATETVSLEWETTADDVGDHEITVSTDDDTVTETVTVDAVSDATFAVGRFIETNSPVTGGDVFVVTATIENTGTAAGEQSVTLEVGDEVRDAVTVALEPGDAQDVSLEWQTTPTDYGRYTFTISTDDENRSWQMSVGAVGDDEFVVDTIETNDPVGVGETLIVTATVENIGTTPGSQTTDLFVNGEWHDWQSATLAPGENETISLEWEPKASNVGDNEVTVTVGNDTVTETAAVDAFGEAAFAIDIVDTNSPVMERDTLTVTATIENVGDTAGVETVVLSARNEVRSEATVELEPGENETVTLEWQTTDGDSPTSHVSDALGVRVIGTDDSASEEVIIRVYSAAVFTIESIETNASVEAGDTLSVRVNLENDGNTWGEQNVTLAVGDEVVDTEFVSLSWGFGRPDIGVANATLEWQTTADDVGDHEITVSTEDDTVTETITVEEEESGGPGLPDPETPEFSLGSLETNTPVEAGNTLTVTVAVENVGDGDGSQTVALAVGGETRDSVTVALDAGETETVTLEWETDEAGASDYEVVVSSDDDQVVESVRVDERPSEGIELDGFTAYDHNGDGLYTDLTGDGRVGFADVVRFFDSLGSAAMAENVDAFDVNGNGQVGFADVVALFDSI